MDPLVVVKHKNIHVGSMFLLKREETEEGGRKKNKKQRNKPALQGSNLLLTGGKLSSENLVSKSYFAKVHPELDLTSKVVVWTGSAVRGPRSALNLTRVNKLSDIWT